MTSQDVGPVLSIIIPTKEESENVTPLLRRLESALQGIDSEFIFVDDSDDDTPRVIGALSQQKPEQVILCHRSGAERQGGLSGAIIDGLKLAQGSYVAVIDADLQHPPELLADLIHRSQSTGADVVVASRYIPGGSAEGLGSGYRKAVSHATRWFSRLLFHNRIWGVKDPLAGFFLFRRSLLEGVELRPIGYKILLEILMRTPWQSVEEVPYRFESRSNGVTKATLKQGLTFFKHATRLFREIPHAGRLWKFLAVGGSGAVIYLALLSLLNLSLGLDKWLAWVIAVEAAVTSNFLLNRSITWQDRKGNNISGLLSDYFRYHGSTGLALLLNAATFWTLSWVGIPVVVAALLAVAVASLTNFIGIDQWVFTGRRSRASARNIAFSIFSIGLLGRK
ncbi:MAG: GtrA family protein [Dehalococcoidia bacterium]